MVHDMRIEPDSPLPPIGGTWPRLYAAVLLVLVLVIFSAWLFSRAYA